MKRLSSILLLLLLSLSSALAVRAQGRSDVLRADYGAGNNWADVTQRVRSMVRGDRLNFRVDNSTLGLGPSYGPRRALRLLVREGNNQYRQLEFRENDSVNLRGLNSSNNFRGLHVLGAQYGAGTRWMDVTDLLNGQIRGDRLRLPVSNQSFGGDPAQNVMKTLTVWYLLDGQPGRVVVAENDFLNLPGGGNGRRDDRDYGDRRDNRDDRNYGNNRDYRSDLQITRAQYGAGGRMMDVTARVRAQMQGGRLSMPVRNDTMGGDPAVNIPKTLTVWYTLDGRPGQLVVNENDILNLPGNSGNGGYPDNRDRR